MRQGYTRQKLLLYTLRLERLLDDHTCRQCSCEWPYDLDIKIIHFGRLAQVPRFAKIMAALRCSPCQHSVSGDVAFQSCQHSGHTPIPIPAKQHHFSAHPPKLGGFWSCWTSCEDLLDHISVLEQDMEGDILQTLFS